jgi:ribosome-associated protein
MSADGTLRVTRSVLVPLAEVVIRVSRSSGPGGQHANTAATRVTVELDLEATSALTDRQRSRAIGRVGTVVRAVAQDERSQARNRELALERLTAKLCEALRVERRRVPMAPTAASRERRLEEKKRRAAVKRTRRPPGEVD